MLTRDEAIDRMISIINNGGHCPCSTRDESPCCRGCVHQINKAMKQSPAEQVQLLPVPAY